MQPSHESEVDAFLAELRAYLITPNPAAQEWPEISDQELIQGQMLVGQLVDLKWGRDYAGHSPLKYQLLSRAHSRLLWDTPIRNEGSLSGNELERVQQENLAICSSAIKAYAEKIAHLSLAMENGRRERVREAAAISIWVRTLTKGGQEFFSIHGDEESACNAEVPAEHLFKNCKERLIRPNIFASERDAFAEFRTWVHESYGKLFDDFDFQNKAPFTFMD